jgi:hypothetical protein
LATDVPPLVLLVPMPGSCHSPFPYMVQLPAIVFANKKLFSNTTAVFTRARARYDARGIDVLHC